MEATNYKTKWWGEREGGREGGRERT